jgi:hypothetical protein
VRAQAAYVVARQQLDAPGSASADAAASAAAAAKQAKKRCPVPDGRPQPLKHDRTAYAAQWKRMIKRVS